MADRTCSAEDCGRPVHCKKLCRTHYAQWQRTGIVKPIRSRYAQCSVDGCTGVRFTDDFCRSHFELHRGTDWQRCKVDGCESPVKSRLLCGAHYQRYRYHDQLDEVAPPVRRPCAFCGEPVSGRRWGAMYCSKRCDDNARHRRRSAAAGVARETCQHCDKPLDGVRNRRDQRFCSQWCNQTWHNHHRAHVARKQRAARAARCPACDQLLGPGRQVFCSLACKRDGRQARKYGMTVRELHALMESQGRACAICRTQEWGAKGPQVDHCHTNGHVRGLLCVGCNTGLGQFKDDTARFRAAIAYLERVVS